MKTNRHQQRVVASRADDERVLDMLRRWERGEDSPTIGSVYGMTQSAVRTVLNRVRRDLALSEDAA